MIHDQKLLEAVSARAMRIAGAGGSSGGKGASGSSGAPDNLFSTSTAKILDLLCEGPIRGVEGADKGIYLNDTPLQNADGGYNFLGTSTAYRAGSSDQTPIDGYPAASNLHQVGIKVNQATPVQQSIPDGDIDRVRVTVQIPALFTQRSDGSVIYNTIIYHVEACYSGGPWVNVTGAIQIQAKSSSPYFRDHEFVLPQNPAGASGPWLIRLHRDMPDTGVFNQYNAKGVVSQNDLIFQSFTTILDARLSYPNSALVGFSAQSTQFGSSVPPRRYLGDWRIVQVPSNYDADARTYTGIWDGTFKDSWTNNPAWVFYDVVTNDRFGLGEFITPDMVNKWELYQIAAYCDGLVDDGHGTGAKEPRHTFNGQISEQQEAYDLLQLIAQAFRGMAYWSSGTVTATQDRPQDTTVLLTAAKVSGGVFDYSSSSRKARHTVVMVKWSDPANLYKPTIEVVEDYDGLSRYGYNPITVDAPWCTSRGQAHRMGLWTLFTELHETQVVTYKADLSHAIRRPGDIIAIQDKTIANLDLSGLLLSGSTNTSLVLDRPVTLDQTKLYSVAVILPDGAVQEVAVTVGASGPTTTLALGSALSQTPLAAAVWVLTSDIVAQKFRIVGLKETKKHEFEVTALQHEPSKFAVIDEGATFEPLPVSDFPNVVAPPQYLTALENQYFENGIAKQGLLLSWTAGSPFNSVAYFVTVLRPDGSILNFPQSSATSVEITDATAGAYTLLVTAMGVSGQVSKAAQLDYTVKGWAGLPSVSVTGLQVKGGGATFGGRSCTMAWTNTFPDTLPPYPVTNVVYVYDTATTALVHREILPTGQTEWTYDYLVNQNEGGPRRTFRVAVTALSVAGGESAQTSLVVTNPAPATIVPSFSTISEAIFVDYPPQTDIDFSGVLVWQSLTSGFNPLTTPPTVDSQSLSTVILKGVKDTTYYIRIAGYDAFGKTGLNISGEYAVKVTLSLYDPFPPNIPDTPVLATVSEISPDGTVASVVSAAWTLDTSAVFGKYEVAFAESPPGTLEQNKNYIVDVVNVGKWERHGFIPGNLISVKVRALSVENYPSGYSPVATITAALNLTPPASPTNFTVTGGFERAYLAWTAPSSADLKWVEVWALPGSSAAAAPPGGAILIATVSAGSNSYQDSALPTTGTRTYWLRSVNTSGVAATSYVGPQAATSAAITSAQMAAGVIDATKLAASITAPSVVTTLPATKTTAFVTLSTDGKLYRWDATAGKYTAGVPAVDVGAGLTAAQISSVNAAAVAGTLTDSQLAGISANKLVGQIVDAQLAAISASKVTGQLTNSQIADLAATKVSGQLSDSQLSAISTTKLVGTVVTAQIADAALTISKFASGLQPLGTVSSLPNPSGYTGPSVVLLSTDGKVYRLVSGAWTSSVSSGDIAGTIAAGQIASLAASQITGQLTDAQVAALSATKLVGQVTDAQVAAIAAAKVTGQLTDTQIAGLSAAKLAGQITGTQITDGAISTAKLAAASVVAGTIAANAITASKLAVGSVNMLFNTEYAQGRTDNLAYPLGYAWGSNGTASIQTVAIRSDYCPSGYTALALTFTKASTSGLADVYLGSVDATGTQNPFFPVNAGQAYEFSAYLSVLYGGNAQIYVTFFQSDKATLVAGSTVSAATTYSNSGVEPRTWEAGGGRPKLFLTAPTGAAYIRLTVRWNSQTAAITTDPYLFISGLMFGPITAAQLTAQEASPYVPEGATVINGGSIVTNTIRAATILSNSITTAQITAGGVNADRLVANSITASQIAASTITATQIAARTIQAANIVAGALTANEIQSRTITALQIATGTITANEVAVGTLTADRIQAGTITGDRLAANTISASKLVITSAFENLCQNGDFEDVTGILPTGWYVGEGAGSGFSLYSEAVAYSGRGMTLDKTSTSASSVGLSGWGPLFPVIPGETYEFSAWVNATSASSAGFYMRMQWFDASGTRTITDLIGSGPVTAGWVKKAFTVTVPAGILTARCSFYNWTQSTTRYIVVDQVVFRKTSGTTAIEDGAITTSKIVAQAVTAAQILANTITTSQIAAGTIVAGNIAANTITAAQIGVGALTAGTIAAGAITTSKLSIASTNLLYNTEFAQRQIANPLTPLGWSVAATNTTILAVSVRNDYCPAGFNSYCMQMPQAAPSGSYCDFTPAYPDTASTTSAFFPASAGAIYEASAYLSVLYGGTAQLYVQCFQADKATVTTTLFGTVVSLNQSGAPAPIWETNGGRTKLFFTAPANTAFIRIGYRWYAGASASTTPYLFVSGPMLAVVTQSQVNSGEFSPYVEDGITAISGSSLTTGSIAASAIVANSITSGQIAARTITASNLVAGTLTANEIAAATITGTNIAGTTITAANLVAGTITAAQIAARTLTADRIVSGAITSNEIAANTIAANNILANTITAGQIAAGAISTTQLAAGAITADKMGVGLSTGNLIWNSDNSIDGFGNLSSNIAGPTLTYRSDWAVAGLRSYCIYCAGTPATNGYAYVDITFPVVSGRATSIPVQGGQQYEFSVYISCHRARAYIQLFPNDGTNYIASATSNVILNNQANGVPNDSWRAKIMYTMPPTTTSVLLRLYVDYSLGQSEPYAFYSGLYFAATTAGQTAFSPYSPQSRTIIDGGAISTNTLNANRIVAGSITTDRMTAGSINADRLVANSITTNLLATNVLTANNITVGSTTLNTWVSGSNSTQINGGSIAANSIQANSLRVGARGIQIVGISFYSERDGNGNLTNVFCWTGGYVLWTDDSNAPQSTYINSGNLSRVGYDGGYWYVFWQKGNTQFTFGKDNWNQLINNQDYVLIATVSGLTGISVLIGGTIIDGTRITTYSIQAAQIAANQIQTQHMAANSISGDRIVAGSLVADKIASGTITAANIYLQNGRFWLDGVNQMLRVTDPNGIERVSIGYTGAFYGNPAIYGVVLRDPSGNEILNSGGVVASRLQGVVPAAGLGAGTGTNLLANAGFNLGTLGCSPNATLGPLTAGIDIAGGTYALSSGHTYTAFLTQAMSVNDYMNVEFRATDGRAFPCVAGQRIEGWCYFNSHRCQRVVYILFYDGSGNLVSAPQSATLPAKNAAGSDLGGYDKLGLFGTVPSGAYGMTLLCRCFGTGESSPYLFVTMPYLGFALPNQTEFSPWNIGGQQQTLTASNLGNFMSAGAVSDTFISNLSANKIAVTALSAFTANVGTVTAGLLQSSDGLMQVDLNNKRILIGQ